MGIEFIRDEADKLRADPLATSDRPGFKRRWVRTKGHAADMNVERFRRLGYEPVRRDAAEVTDDPRRKRGEVTKDDGTIRYDDVMLMEIPTEKHEEYRASQQALTRRRSGDVGKKFTHENPGTFDETRVKHSQEE
jgi:hypothetical protein